MPGFARLIIQRGSRVADRSGTTGVIVFVREASPLEVRIRSARASLGLIMEVNELIGGSTYRQAQFGGFLDDRGAAEAQGHRPRLARILQIELHPRPARPGRRIGRDPGPVATPEPGQGLVPDREDDRIARPLRAGPPDRLGPVVGKIELRGPVERLVGQLSADDPTDPVGARARVPLGDQIPGVALGDQAERRDGDRAARCRTS